MASQAAPAKINLDLIVTGKRLDGYHELDSLVVFTAFGDRLEYEPANQFSLQIQGPFAADTPIDGNIILKASDLMAAHFKGVRPLAFTLCKNMPVASGIGGGSSDAAAALKAIRETSVLTISDEDLRDLGAELGADIPVCLYGQSARMRDTGSRLDPVRGLPEMPLVLINPGIAQSTAEVFQKSEFSFERFTRPSLTLTPSVTGLAVWLKSSRNDLEPAAISMAPEIQIALEALDQQDGILLSRMSGSGATVFGLFNDPKRADRAAALIRQKHPHWWINATRTLT